MVSVTKDDATWLNICYIVFAMIVAYIVYKAAYTVGLQFGFVERYDEWFPLVSRVCSIVAGGGGRPGGEQADAENAGDSGERPQRPTSESESEAEVSDSAEADAEPDEPASESAEPASGQ